MRIPPPRSWLDVRYYTGVSTCLGNFIPVESTAVEPSLKWRDLMDSGSHYGNPSVSNGYINPSPSPSTGSDYSSGSVDPSAAGDPYDTRPIGRQINEINSSSQILQTNSKQTGYPYYTVLFLDPDCDFVEGSGVRWVRTNVPYDKPDLSGDIVFPYFPPVLQTPTGATGSGKRGGFIHRCVFLVYRERNYVDPYAVHDYIESHTTDFYPSDFARVFNLDPIPTAGNFFYGSFNPIPTMSEGKSVVDKGLIWE